MSAVNFSSLSTPNYSAAVRDRLVTAAEATLAEAKSYFTSVGTRSNSEDTNYSHIRFAEDHELEYPEASPTIILEISDQTYRFGGTVDCSRFVKTLAGM